MPRSRSLRRPRSSQAQAVSMQLKVSAAGASESMESKRRSVKQGLFSENERHMTGWMTTLRNFDVPEMPFDEMLKVWDDTEKLMNVSKESRQKRVTRYKHFDLRVRGGER